MMNDLSKRLINYHRSYRKLPGTFKSFFFQFIFFSVPLVVITAYYYPQITFYLCSIVKYILEPFYYPDTIKIWEKEYITQIGALYYLSVPGSYPSALLSLLSTIISGVALIVLPKIQRWKPLIIFLIIILTVHFISSLFFLFLPGKFPYNVADYSQLYMIQEISIWFFVPVLMGMAILPLPAGIVSKAVVLLFTYIYSFVFGTIRYAVFLYVLSKISMIYMGVLFFALGPLVDFIYIVGIYSFYLNRLANKLAGDYVIWKWQ